MLCVCFIILLFIRKTRGTELLWSPVRAGSCMFVWIMLRMISPETAGTRTRKTPKGSKRKTKKRWRLLLTRLRKCIWGNFLRKELYSIYCFWRENCHNLTILRSYLSFWILYLFVPHKLPSTSCFVSSSFCISFLIDALAGGGKEKTKKRAMIIFNQLHWKGLSLSA